MTISEEMSVMRLTVPRTSTVEGTAARTRRLRPVRRPPGDAEVAGAGRPSARYTGQPAQIPLMSLASAARPACEVPYMSSRVRSTS